MNDRKARRSRPRRRNGLIEILNGFLTLAVLAMLLVGGGLLFLASQFYGDSAISQDTAFIVQSGDTLGSTSERMESLGLISNRYVFDLGRRVSNVEGTLKPGEYRIPAKASMSDILIELLQGKPVLYAVTVPEGWTSWQVVQRLDETPNLIGELTGVPPEGSILPNTYNFNPGDTRQSVLDAMQAAMTTQLAAAWETRRADLPIQTPEQLLVLASIVEKETGVATERPQVAAVFVNRLKQGMRLQSDPTIIYGITKGQETLGRGLRRSEIEAETPYNTYQIDGLPPTPIANPGIDALEAVANPDSHDYLYFVAKGATPDQGHVFAATYREHQANVAKFRAIEREQAQIDAEAAKAALEASEAEGVDEAAPQ
ncbi:endolytic transglycosylase MltG [uncultured Devosia sp.]|uniref:endolytic transglycosylase MltG n=1 Tax=uncultured Devosia sp. TaxID=211434 RepID=UPI0035CAB8EA